MGDQNTVLDEPAARRLLRRVGFGAMPKELPKFVGRTRGEAVDILLGFRPKGFKPSGPGFERAQGKWIKYMVKTRLPLQEKLVLFWHDHFATGFSKVLDPKLMSLQNKTIRLACKGDMRVLVKAMNRDAAMIEWLDTVRNRKRTPNENYARELKELFTLGVYDFQGNENYTQADIVQTARAFTGWTYDRDNGLSYFNQDQHDFMANYDGNPASEENRGPKVLFGSAAAYGPGGKLGGFASPQSFAAPEGETEIDQVIEIIFQHRDSDGKNTVARRTTRRLLEFFCHGGWADPDAAMVGIIDDELIGPSGFATTFVVQDVLRAIFVHDVFYNVDPRVPAAPSVKWPTDFVVSTLRLLRMKGKGRDLVIEGGARRPLRDHLESMGQILLDPPSVFGWDWENAWISSATLLARYGFARDLTSAREGGARFKPEKLMSLGLTDPDDIVDAVTGILGVGDAFPQGGPERNALITYLGGQSASLDLLDYDTKNRKLHGLFLLVIQSPAYQVH